MCPARLTAPATSSRWTDEEHDILVDLTNDQLALETKDESKVISWSRHWDNVSSQLHKHGYSRTPAACLGYWKRTVGAQKANEKAAGPRWEDAEHQILFGMTEEQLELESVDPSATMPWARHWKRVSERLKENGYNRSVDACDAYWNLVQDNSPLAVGTGPDAESTQTESSVEEPPFEVNCAVDNDRSVVKEVSESPPKAETPSAPTESKPASFPARWSSVNEQKNVSAASESPSIEVAPSPHFQKDDSQLRMMLPDEGLNVSRGSPSKRPKTTAFRFNPDQRAFLEEEAARNGANPDQGRRADLAAELGVEEKTVRVWIVQPSRISKADGSQNWFVHHRQRASRRSLEHRPRDEFSYTNDHSLPKLAAKRSYGSSDEVDAIEVNPRGATDSPSYVQPLKKPRLEDEYSQHPTGETQIHSTVSAPSNSEPTLDSVKGRRGLPWIHEDDLDESKRSGGSAGPPGTAEGQNNQVTVESMIHAGKRPSVSDWATAQAALNAHYNMMRTLTEANRSRETEHPQPYSGPQPPTNVETHQTFDKTSIEYESATPVSRNMNPSGARRSSQYSNKTEFPEPSSATLQPGTQRSDNDKTWASRRVEEIQAQIQGLKVQSQLRWMGITQIDREIEVVKNQAGELDRQKAEEIARVLRDIEMRYEKEHELLKEKQNTLSASKGSELDALRKNERQVEKNEKKVKSYQILVDLDDDSDSH